MNRKQYLHNSYLYILLMWKMWASSFLLLLASCNEKQSQDGVNIKLSSDSSEADVRASTSETQPYNSVHELLPVGGDTFFAVKHNGGLLLTTDAGTHWQHLHDQEFLPDFLFVKYLTIDQHGVLWGLDSWKGIHEADYSRLSYSPDFGKTWMKREYNTKEFFPYEIYSQPGQPLQLITYDGTVVQMQDKIGREWLPISHFPEQNYSVNDTIYDDSYFAQGRYKFLKEGKLFERSEDDWQLVGATTFVNKLNDVCSCNGKTYFTSRGSAFGDTHDYLLTARTGQMPADTLRLKRTQRAGYLRCDSRNRLWLFNYRGIWLKVGNEFQRRY